MPARCASSRCGCSGNALSRRTSAALSALIDDFEQDDNARVAVLTGEGSSAFCTGGYLCDNDRDATLPATGFGGLARRFDRTKPIIAAVNGLALGGGFELALACDIILAEEGARFDLTEARVGLAALEGGLQRLPRLSVARASAPSAKSVRPTGRERNNLERLIKQSLNWHRAARCARIARHRQTGSPEKREIRTALFFVDPFPPPWCHWTL
jgi:hypothetical protein